MTQTTDLPQVTYMHSTGPRKGIRLDQEHAFAWTKQRYSLGPRKCIHLGQKMSFTYEPKLNQYMLYYNDGTVAVPITLLLLQSR
jgi:hypothetical protein